MHKIINETFEVHETLNPKLFENNHLKPEIHEALLRIVGEFEKYVRVPIKIVDIQLCGSNCSYNYTATSDLDVHIIANFDTVTDDIDILQSLYNAKKKAFNDKYDIKLHGIEVELYIQDIKSTVVSNGIYSLCDDRWVKEPKPIKSITKHNTDSEVERWTQAINSAVSTNDYEKMDNLLNNIYLVRHNSIAVDGEYGKGNQIFKDVRSLGLLDKLSEALRKATEDRLSLESLSEGQIVSRMK